MYSQNIKRDCGKGGEWILSKDVYELLALAARYLFAGLMLLIVLRAWRITIVDNRRARKLRQMSPETGLSGELVVLEGGEKARNGMRYPVIREGMIGSSKKADVRIRHSSVRRVHAYFELGEEGLSLRAHGNAPMSKSWEDPVRTLLLRDGDTVEFGQVQLLLVLSGAQGGSRVSAPDRDPDDGIFALGGANPPRKRPMPQRRRADPLAAFEGDEGEQSLYDDIFGTPDQAPAKRRSAPLSRDDGLFSVQEFPEGDSPRPVRKKAARREVESPLARKSAQRGGQSARGADPDEDLWL